MTPALVASLLPWGEFAICMLAIGLAGPQLTRYGDKIAVILGLSRSWIGLVLLATATSLPELFTGMSAVMVAGQPEIAVGNALGACVLNLAMLVVLDESSRKEPMYRRVDQGHLLAAGFGVVMIGAAGASLLLSHQALRLSILHVSIFSPLIVLLYVVAMRASFDYERRMRPPADLVVTEEMTLAQALARYGTAAAVVVAAGAWLPFIGAEIAEVMGWKTSFVGTLVITGATSLPELVVTLSALRLGAVDMAIGNILGSNLFDILILALDDIFYAKGPLLADVSAAHAITAFAAVVMSGIFVVAMLFKPESRVGGIVGWVSIALLMVYLASAYVSFVLG